MVLSSELLALIGQGESYMVEFKKSTSDITKDVYNSVCAFSNRDGGHIFLGINDNGQILGIQPDRIEQMKKDFITSVNNENKMYPPLYLTPIQYEYNEKIILYIRVPSSSNVCRCNGRIYDRNHESDIDITNHSDEVYRLYSRKNNSYFVNKVTRFKIDSLRSDLIARARKMARSKSENHPWQSMSDAELLRSAGLILTDEYTQREGITVAAILLFGQDRTIMSILPQHKTDAIFRIINTDRYDDREIVITNLIESYDRLLTFGQKHLNNTFHLEGVQSVSARDHILREIGMADELGSGMRNTYKYTKMYSGGEPVFMEGDIFKITVPLSQVATATIGPNIHKIPTNQNNLVSDQVNDQVNDQDIEYKIIDFCKIPRSKKDICAYLGYKNLTFFSRKYLNPLLETEKLIMTIPAKPKSRNQKYVKK